jgi:RNA polymerase sigma factor (sigma-70 family)
VDGAEWVEGLDLDTRSTGKCEFDQLWRSVRPAVLGYCRHLMRNASDAEELYQRVMVRAWRGHATFRGDSAYLTWVVRIAAREASRLQAQIWQHDRRERPLDDRLAMLAEAPEQRSGAQQRSWLADVISHASDIGALTPAEAQVIRLRLASPGSSWAGIAAELGTTQSACAVLHCRAVPKLRVVLFTAYPEVLGGEAEVAKAFLLAAADPVRPLTTAEAEAFRAVVLEGRSNYRRRGWQTNLRAACAAVIRYLQLPEVDPEPSIFDSGGPVPVSAR